MKLLIQYIRQRLLTVLFFVLCVAIFFLTFSLYGLPLAAVAYPAALCALLLGLMLFLDYARAKRRHRNLEKLCKMPEAMIAPLPDETDMIGQDYQRVIQHLRLENRKVEQEMGERYRDMIDYYTVWAHQIKTPITSMRLNVQAENTPFSGKIRADLFRIEQYVDMVLAFLRLGSSSTDYVIHEYDLDAILTKCIKRFSGEFIARKLSLRYTPVYMRVITDEKWLAFVIEQLLSNALKYTSEGSISIYQEGGKTLCIEDTGSGIAPDDLPRVFEKGYTGYHGREQQAATGIGLYLCRNILNKLGHHISATSVLGRGTVIRIDLSRYPFSKE